MQHDMYDEQILFRSARLVDGRGVLRERADLLVADGRIQRIDSQIRIDDAHVIDLAGRTLVPGLMNAHVHICFDGSADPASRLASESLPVTAVRAASRLRTTLAMGVTTVRDLGAIGGIAIDLGRLTAEGELVGPRVLAAGRVVTMTGGHGHWMGEEADGPDAARRAVRSQLKAGATTIKVMATGGMMTTNQEAGAPQLTIEEMAAAVEEAHKGGVIVAAHAESEIGARNAILAGVDSIEHGHGITMSTLELMRERGVALVPTILSDRRILEGGAEAGIPGTVVDACRRLAPSLVTTLEAAIASGVLIVAGNDGGAPLVHPGEVAAELELYVRHGMSAQAALASATSSAATLFRLPDAGRIDEGCRADLLVVRGDPLSDIGTLRDLDMVLAAGRIVAADQSRSAAVTSTSIV
jgi:imidazolonepropionase-like amidohydrolase